MSNPEEPTLVAIACGGTGGHFFPGLAVADALQKWGCEIALLISPKEVDQEAIKSAIGMQVITLPAVALQNRRWASFVRGCWRSYRLCRKAFRDIQPRAVLAMGGFTSAPPILAAKAVDAATYLHESNTVPGRANRWLSPWVDEIFVGFPAAAQRLYNQSVRHVGTPVRPQFKPTDPAPCRMALGLHSNRPVLLIMGGSQGAAGINRLVKGAIPILAGKRPDLQFLHLTGAEDYAGVQAEYAAHGCRAVVRPFLTEMDLALGAATITINRAGASSIAELAAMRVPCILVPFPHATDDHQLSNARALANSGAALVFEQTSGTPAELAEIALDLLGDKAAQAAMQRNLEQWHFPNAGAEMARHISMRLGMAEPETGSPEESLSFSVSRMQLPRVRPHPGLKFQMPTRPAS